MTALPAPSIQRGPRSALLDGLVWCHLGGTEALLMMGGYKIKVGGHGSPPKTEEMVRTPPLDLWLGGGRSGMISLGITSLLVFRGGGE